MRRKQRKMNWWLWRTCITSSNVWWSVRVLSYSCARLLPSFEPRPTYPCVFGVCWWRVRARRTMGLRLRKYCQCYNLMLLGLVTMRFLLMWFSRYLFIPPGVFLSCFFFRVPNCLNGTLQPAECQNWNWQVVVHGVNSYRKSRVSFWTCQRLRNA